MCSAGRAGRRPDARHPPERARVLHRHLVLSERLHCRHVVAPVRLSAPDPRTGLQEPAVDADTDTEAAGVRRREEGTTGGEAVLCYRWRCRQGAAGASSQGAVLLFANMFVVVMSLFRDRLLDNI